MEKRGLRIDLEMPEYSFHLRLDEAKTKAFMKEVTRGFPYAMTTVINSLAPPSPIKRSKLPKSWPPPTAGGSSPAVVP